MAGPGQLGNHPVAISRRESLAKIPEQYASNIAMQSECWNDKESRPVFVSWRPRPPLERERRSGTRGTRSGGFNETRVGRAFQGPAACKASGPRHSVVLLRPITVSTESCEQRHLPFGELRASPIFGRRPSCHPSASQIDPGAAQIHS